MKHLKEKLIEEINCIEHEIEANKEIHEEQLNLAYRLAKTYYYLDKIPNLEPKAPDMSKI